MPALSDGAMIFVASSRRNEKGGLHFRFLTHPQKIAVAQRLGKKNLRAISVLSNKTTIQPGVYNSPNQLNFFFDKVSH
jgi:hypothetical protein